MSDLDHSPAAGCRQCVVLSQALAELKLIVLEQAERIRQLEARLNQNSSNSHQPPSSDPPSAPKPPAKKPTGRRRGGQAGHPGHRRLRLPVDRIDRFVHYRPSECQHCHGKLAQEDSVDDPSPRWHQVAELPLLTALVSEHQAHGKVCLCCGRTTYASIPTDIRAHAFGPRLSATLSYLSSRCHDSKRTVAEIVSDLFNVPIALGTVSNYEAEMTNALQNAHQQALEHVQRAAVKNVDETGWKETTKNKWLWTAATRTVAMFKIFTGRTLKAFKELLGEKVRGVVHSDRCPTYSHLPDEKHQWCWSHLKRDFQKWLELSKATKILGGDGLKITGKVFARWREFAAGRFSRQSLRRRIRRLSKQMHWILRWGLRCSDLKARQFCRNILAHEKALWTFADKRGVEPTNNHAERMLRRGVLWRKNCFATQSLRGSQFVERTLTVIQTLRMQNRNVMDFFRQTLTAHRQRQPLPNLV